MLKLPELFLTPHTDSELVAAVDLGSNSFHMIVARISDGQLHILDRLRDSVRLRAGLDAYNRLSTASQQRALDCLARFGQRLSDIPTHNVRVVGTNTLRTAVNAADFLSVAEAKLNHPIEIISGREEARLIYLGVAHSLANNKEKRLVIDIGGGSTEFIIGKGFDALRRESLSMGCVSFSQHYFPHGDLLPKAMRQAEIAALLELQPVEKLFRETGWDLVIGASGTLRNVERVIVNMGWANQITFESLQKLRNLLVEARHIEQLTAIKGLSPERAAVFAGGVAIISGIFEGLNLQTMQISEGALREGLLYDLLGRINHEDVRERTIQNLIKRHHIDTSQAERVERTALALLAHAAPNWGLVNEEYAHMLSWAACLHEVGLTIAHDQYHKHGEYILTYADLAGFSREEQRVMATLVRMHRRKFNPDNCQNSTQIEPNKLLRLCVLLRLAVLLNRSRSTQPLPDVQLHVADTQFHIQFPPDWLAQHPLTYADLEQEQVYLQEAKWQFSFT